MITGTSTCEMASSTETCSYEYSLQSPIFVFDMGVSLSIAILVGIITFTFYAGFVTRNG